MTCLAPSFAAVAYFSMLMPRLAAVPHTQVRCLVDVPGPKLPSDLPGYLRATVAPQVPPELRQAFLTAIDNEAIRSMQNKQVSCQPMHQPGELS
jgi:squalene monooxygenase